MSNTLWWFADSVRRQGEVRFPGGEGKTAPIDVLDIAAVAAAALTGQGHEGKDYPLTGPELLSMGDMVEILAKVLGKPLRYIDLAESVLAEGMRKQGMDPTTVDYVIETLSEIRTGGLAHLTDTVERVTGRQARTYEAWCRDHLAAFQ